MKYIKELLDKSVEFYLKVKKLNEYRYEFYIGDKRYIVYIFRDSLEHADKIEILDNNPVDAYFCSEIHFELQQKNVRTSDITGTGDQFTVFSTILSIMKNYISREYVPYWAIMAKHDDKSRVKLYEFFAKKLEREIPYKYIGKEVLKYKEGEFYSFYLKKM